MYIKIMINNETISDHESYDLLQIHFFIFSNHYLTARTLNYISYEVLMREVGISVTTAVY